MHLFYFARKKVQFLDWTSQNQNKYDLLYIINGNWFSAEIDQRELMKW